MSSWSIDMARQSGWDLWVLVCVAASLVVLSYQLLGKLSLTAFLLGSIAIAGTLLVVFIPSLHQPLVGLIWTFCLLCILSATFYFNLCNHLGTNRTVVLLSMRVVSLALLVPMLFEPVLRIVTKTRPQRPLLFLIDTSGSMSFPDGTNGPTRLQSVWQAIRPELKSISDHFVPRYICFDSTSHELKTAEELALLPADGKSTDLVGAVNAALSKTMRSDADVVLITDGIDNTSANPVDALRACSHAIHTVRVGSDQTELASVANVAVENIERPDDFVVNHNTPVKATIKSTGLANRVVDVNLSELDENGKTTGEVRSQKLVLQPTPAGQLVELSYQPKRAGLHRVAVWINPVAGERSTADNRQEFQGLATDPRMKVLYIEGSIRLEYKWTRQAFICDSNIELATFLRKDNLDVEAGGTVDGETFLALPATAEGWKKFDVIIIGDIDSNYFSQVQQQLIEQRVGSGAGLLMLGGQKSFGPGGYEKSSIEKILPVFVGNPYIGQDKSKFVPDLTQDGCTHPILDGITEWFGINEKAGVRSLPALNGNVIVSRPKSGAQVLMRHLNRPGPDGKDEIVLAVQRYGRGRSAAFTVDTTYLWFLPLRGMGQESPYNKLWGQMIRWLAGQDVRAHQRGAGLEALLNKSNYPLGENVNLRARVRDEHGDITRFAQVNATLTEVNGKSKTFALTSDGLDSGVYQVTLPSLEKGDYCIEVSAAKDGRMLGQQKLSFTVNPPADELLKIASNPHLLAEISNQTHGYHIELGEFPQLIDQLIKSDPSLGAAEQQSIPLDDFPRAIATLIGIIPDWNAKYDLPLQGFTLIVLLVTEWLLRRWWHLP